MNVKFTKASKNDKTLVTVALAQFDNTELDFHRLSLNKGDEITFVIDGVPTVFTVNRTNKFGVPTTASSHCFPRFLRLPQVGHPIHVEVQDVR